MSGFSNESSRIPGLGAEVSTQDCAARMQERMRFEQGRSSAAPAVTMASGSSGASPGGLSLGTIRGGQEAAIAAPGPLPCSPTDHGCGTLPEPPGLVTRGETLAHVDWLAFTVPPTADRPFEWLRAALNEIFALPADAWIETGRGWFGYTHRVNLGGFGLLAYGGERQRGTIHVELNGQACARIPSWNEARRWGEEAGAKITRLDLAHDDFEAKTVNIETARHWYDSGGFNSSGRPPEARLYDDLGTGKGKTLYIGNRKNGKIARLYEKGKEQGDRASPWFRVEVEWRNKDRVIPWDALIRPGNYLAGAYPCLRFLTIHQEKIRTVKQGFTVNYAQMVKWLKTSAGRALNVMLTAHDGDATAVVVQLVRCGVPKRLEGYSSMYRSLAPGCVT